MGSEMCIRDRCEPRDRELPADPGSRWRPYGVPGVRRSVPQTGDGESRNLADLRRAVLHPRVDDFRNGDGCEPNLQTVLLVCVEMKNGCHALRMAPVSGLLSSCVSCISREFTGSRWRVIFTVCCNANLTDRDRGDSVDSKRSTRLLP